MKYTKFHELIDGLIKLNKANRKSLDGETLNISPVFYAIELCTVRCDIGRRTEKTEYIRRNAIKGDLIVTSNQQFKASLFKDMPCDVVTSHDLLVSNGYVDIKTIWIDEPYMIFKNFRSLHDLYEKLVSPKKDQTFVFMGR